MIENFICGRCYQEKNNLPIDLEHCPQCRVGYKIMRQEIEKLKREIERLTNDLEKTLLQLASCGAAALG